MSTNRPEEEWDLPDPPCRCPPPYETVRGLCETCGGVVPKDTSPPKPKKLTRSEVTRDNLRATLASVKEGHYHLKGLQTHLLSNVNRSRLAMALRALDLILEDAAAGCP